MTAEPGWLGIEPRHLATLRAVAAADGRADARAPPPRRRHRADRGRDRAARPCGCDPRPAAHGAGRHGALGDHSAAPLRVGITQSVGIQALPDIVRRFARDWPQVRIQPLESETDLDLYGGVEQGKLDLTFVELPAPSGPLETLSLLVDPYVLVVRSDSPLARPATAPRWPRSAAST